MLSRNHNIGSQGKEERVEELVEIDVTWFWPPIKATSTH